jgi:L-lactate dehydrogenase (cytochrome)
MPPEGEALNTGRTDQLSQPVGGVAPPLPGGVRAEARPIAAVPPRLQRFLSLDDFERAARRHLPRMLYGFVSGAVETDASLRNNRDAFQDWAFVPRVLQDVSARQTETMLLGHRHAAPFGIAPMGASALSAYRGDLVFARTAAAAGIPMILSASSLIRLEEVRAEGPSAWYQAYLPGEPGRILPLVDRVAAAGFETLVLTVDVPVSSNRENNVRNGYSLPLRPNPRLFWEGISHPHWLFGTALRTLWNHGMPHFENMDADRGPPVLSPNLIRAVGRRDGLAWEHLALIRERWQGQLIVKGVLSAEDARMAREYGADGVIVSNHGGRQLDGAIAPLHVLPEIAAVAGGMTVMLDGGIRRGTDVLKALALGADFVFLGRPFLYAAAVGGEAGLRHAITLLWEEIHRDMAMLGITDLAQLGPELLRRVRGG